MLRPPSRPTEVHYQVEVAVADDFISQVRQETGPQRKPVGAVLRWVSGLLIPADAARRSGVPGRSSVPRLVSGVSVPCGRRWVPRLSQ